MKIKRDFVTNSSSTSFIISTANLPIKDIKLKLKIEVPISEILDKTILNKEEALQFISEYGYEPEDDHAMKILEAIDEGRIVHILYASSEDEEPIAQFLCYEGLKEILMNKDEIVVIQGEGGY